MKVTCFLEYEEERKRLSSQQIDAILEAGRRWDLSPALSRGGVAIFPHTYLHVCGDQIASCVHAVLDSGIDQVLALGVLHSTTRQFQSARARERAHDDITDLDIRGVHGPNLRRGSYWKDEYSLLSFAFLLKEECRRRGKKPPKLKLRYPYLVNRDPRSLPGIKELERIAKDSCIVATIDFCHHGLAYGMKKEETYTGAKALQFARKNIETNLRELQVGNFERYYQNCLDIRSDSFDVGPMIYHLRGPMKTSILDVKLVDASMLFEGNPSPSWVAASLVKAEK